MLHSPRVDPCDDSFSSDESLDESIVGTITVLPYQDSSVRVSSLKVSQDSIPVTTTDTAIDWYSEAGLLIQVRGGDDEQRYASFETLYKHSCLLDRDSKPERIPVPLCIPMFDKTEGFVHVIRGGISKWHRCLEEAVAGFIRHEFTIVEVTVISIGVDPNVQIFNRRGDIVSNGSLLLELQNTIETMRREGKISNSRYVNERPMKKSSHRMHVLSPDIPAAKHEDVINRPAPREPMSVKELKRRARRNAANRVDPTKRPAKRVRS